MSSAEALAEEFERGENEVSHSGGGKRSKAEQVEHKHHSIDGNIRQMVTNCQNGEHKRKEQNAEK